MRLPAIQKKKVKEATAPTSLLMAVMMSTKAGMPTNINGTRAVISCPLPNHSSVAFLTIQMVSKNNPQDIKRAR